VLTTQQFHIIEPKLIIFKAQHFLPVPIQNIFVIMRFKFFKSTST